MGQLCSLVARIQFVDARMLHRELSKWIRKMTGITVEFKNERLRDFQIMPSEVVRCFHFKAARQRKIYASRSTGNRLRGHWVTDNSPTHAECVLQS